MESSPFEKPQVAELLKNFPTSYETEGLLPWSQASATGPHPESDESFPYHPNLFL
jgi:hypothetical protein